MTSAHIRGGRRRTNGAVIRLRFKDYGRCVPGGPLLDEGSARSRWTSSSPGTTWYDKTQSKDGPYAFALAGSQNLSTPYTHSNKLVGDYFIGFWLYCSVSVNANCYIISVQGTTGDNTDTAFIFYAGTASALFHYLCNGTTRAAAGGTQNLTANAWQYIHGARSGSTVRVGLGGTWSATTLSMSGNVLFPASRTIRIGKPEIAAGGIADTGNAVYIQDFDMLNHDPYNGASFTPPPVSVPYSPVFA